MLKSCFVFSNGLYGESGMGTFRGILVFGEGVIQSDMRDWWSELMVLHHVKDLWGPWDNLYYTYHFFLWVQFCV